jgi:hypothetical protein
METINEITKKPFQFKIATSKTNPPFPRKAGLYKLEQKLLPMIKKFTKMFE